MANATDSGAHRVHGTDPQYLIEKIIRQHIYDSPYWKEKCFGLDAATLVDQAVQLTYCGGMYSEHVVPTPFLCLTLKLLQLSPPAAVVAELLHQSAYKYIRLLAALHIRLTARAEDVYALLDGLLSDWRKVRRRREDGTWELLHVDELVDELLVKERCCSVTLPRIAKREQLIAAGRLQDRKSALLDMMDDDKDDEARSKENETERQQKEAAATEADERKESEASGVKPAAAQSTSQSPPAVSDSAQASGVDEGLPARPSGGEEEGHRRREDDRSDRRSDRRERDSERDRGRGRDEDRSPKRRRGDRDDTSDAHRRHSSSSSRHHRRRDYSPSRSRSPDRERHSRRRERDDDRERRRHEDRHHRRRRSASSSRSRSRSPRHRRRRSRS